MLAGRHAGVNRRRPRRPGVGGADHAVPNGNLDGDRWENRKGGDERMGATLSVEDDLTALFEGQRLDDPYPVWNRAREAAPVIRLPSLVLVTRFAEVKELLT